MSTHTIFGIFAIQRLSFNFLCTQQKKKDSVPKVVVFLCSLYLTRWQKASKVPAILSWGLLFEVDVEFYLGVNFSLFLVLCVLLCNEL